VTLLVAGISADTVWMVSDTLITGGTIGLRDREYQIKCVPSHDGKALIGFAGDVHHGARLMEQAAGNPADIAVVNELLNGHREYPETEFVYGYIDERGPHLFKISGCEAHELPVAHIGRNEAFSDFQRIRHATEITPIPKAVEIFMLGSRAPGKIPNELHIATVSMLRLFVERSERNVGGWAVPYLLASDGAFMCGYGYSVSDPILDQVAPGAIVPHGTAEAGGYGLSVTELGHNEGMVVYWLQIPGGLVLTRQNGGFGKLEINGAPSVFKSVAHDAIGKSVDVFFGEKSHGRPDSVTVLHDALGQPTMAVAKRGQDISFSVLKVATPFKSTASLDFSREQGKGKTMSTQNLTLTLSEDGHSARLALLENGKPVGQTTVNVSELDNVIAGLGEIRVAMSEQVSAEPNRTPGMRELMIVDPAWRTEMPVHPDLDGIVVRLRHTAFGWLTFLLPNHEADALATWLSKNTKNRGNDMK
jgi:hypothetical protein